MYQSEGAIVIASRKLMVPGVEAMSTPTGDAAIIRSEMAVLRSRTLLAEVADELKLDKLPEFNPALRPPGGDWLALIDPRPFLAELLHPGSQPPVSEKDRVAAEVEATLQKHLELVNDDRDYVITIRYRSQNPKLSAAIVNTLISKYLTQYTHIKITAAEEANASLNTRAEDLRREIAEADAKVREFTAKHQVLETRFGTASTQQLEDLSTQLSLARADRAAAEARYKQVLALARGGSAGANSDVLASPLIQRLQEQEAELLRHDAAIERSLGPDHPSRKASQAQLARLHQVIAEQTRKVSVSLAGQVSAARAREASLESRVAQLRAIAFDAGSARSDLELLKSDAAAKRKIYSDFLAKLSETAKPGDRPPIEARMISAAVAPIQPAGSRGTFLVLIAGVIGSLAGIAGALTYDRLDHGFDSLDQIRDTTGLPAYAAIPRIVGARSRSYAPRSVANHPHSPLAETLRGFRVRLRQISQDPRVILLTSADPGEGKTSFANAFAAITAHDGWRTLLIDCDLRRASSHAQLAGGELSQLVEQKVEWRDYIRSDEASGLHSLLLQDPRASFSALLERVDFGGFINQLRTVYDYIVIDSPPVMRVADAALLTRFVDAVVVAVAARRTRQRRVAEAVRRLSVSPPKNIGLVLINVAGRKADSDIYSGYPGAARWRGI